MYLTESGSMTKHNINYRFRFLQKSHLAVKRPNEQLYACVFCVKTGYTMDESDATVFFSADDLLAHISRHVRPLPVVSGISVIYGTNVPSHLAQNYDLHFKVPKDATPIPNGGSTEVVESRPTGVVMKELRRDETTRRIIANRNRTEQLQVAFGAKVTGIIWPPQYDGRKIFAWHNGTFASVPSNLVMLTAPPMSDSLVNAGGNGARATAKWKFSPPKRDKTTWLKFDKGDEITNIGCEYFIRYLT